MSVLAAAASWAPDYEAFTAGVELGLYAGLLAIAVLSVVATIRRILGA